ncbi:MAG TPA: metalloregulator ArsR/SmtB family transcription factor [Chloroflexaceae bacterium]|nr:metalloregulator ArsR/SmtB family transcription factor [Chloroflexaceae bacterium]
MEEQSLQDTLRYLKAMAHESRLRLLGLLAAGEYSVRDLAELIELKEPTVSHHLAIMHEVGLVRMRPVGTSHLYSLDGETLQRLGRELLSPARVAALGEQAEGDAFERKVLRNFVDGERLLKIPDQLKKRQVILRWLVERFDRDRRYHERELNAIIKRHHEDAATLRRELIMAGLMRREADVYWRT